jgi:hypothetical protein
VSRRRAAIAMGVGLAAAYAASAALSGHLSPLARGPLLDGLAPPQPYRWVEPPPDLAGANVSPSAASFPVELGGRGSVTAVVTTDDAQVTLVLPRGAFASAPGQDAVSVSIEPIGPSTVAAPAEGVDVIGNVYRVSARYRPSGDRARLEPVEGLRLILTYPLLGNDHGGHELLALMRDGGWAPVETNDLPSVQQVDGPIESLGAFAVGATGLAPTPPPGADPQAADDGWSAATIAIGAGLVALVIGTAIVLRPRRSASRPERGAARGSRRSR